MAIDTYCVSACWPLVNLHLPAVVELPKNSSFPISARALEKNSGGSESLTMHTCFACSNAELIACRIAREWLFRQVHRLCVTDKRTWLVG